VNVRKGGGSRILFLVYKKKIKRSKGRSSISEKNELLAAVEGKARGGGDLQASEMPSRPRRPLLGIREKMKNRNGTPGERKIYPKETFPKYRSKTQRIIN